MVCSYEWRHLTARTEVEELFTTHTNGNIIVPFYCMTAQKSNSRAINTFQKTDAKKARVKHL